MKNKHKANKHLQKHLLSQKGARDRTRTRSDRLRRRLSLEAMVNELGYSARDVHLKDSEELGAPRHLGRREERCVGTFYPARGGFGFVRCADEERDIFIPRGSTGTATGGDTVEVVFRRLMRDDATATEGRITHIRARLDTVVGTLVERSRPYYERHRGPLFTLLPDDRRLHIEPHVTDIGAARVGDKVELRLTHTPGGMRGAVRRVFGRAGTREAVLGSTLCDLQIEDTFTEDALREADEAARRPLDRIERTDLTEELTFTVDGADAKDLDDALSVRRLRGGGYRLGVHIADVSYFVDERTALDRTVMRRGSSIYLADRVIPMLPPVLSNGVCSLSEGQTRATVSAHITLSADGRIRGLELRPTLIRSRLRGVYSEVNDLLEHGTTSPFFPKYRRVHRALETLRELSEVLARRRRAEGMLELAGTEAQILFDEAGEPTEILPRTVGVAEGIVEHCMLLANEAVAIYLREHALPCVHRAHERPPLDKAHELLAFASALGLSVRGKQADRLTPHDLGALIDEAAERGFGVAMSYRVLRSLAKAKYRSDAGGHFGLGLTDYCHFTAPIRRVADLAVHRILHRTVFADGDKRRLVAYTARAAPAATEGELRAAEAQRRVERFYKALYLSRHIGECFEATVSGITAFGVFCTLPNTCEGRIELEDLGGVFTFDEATASLRSADARIRIGDRLRVRLIDASPESGEVRFEQELTACYREPPQGGENP